MTQKPRYLTKSLFKTALDCEAKLFYAKKRDEYPDQRIDDEFLQSLAAGGYQVGELAKFRFCDDPYAAGITIETLGYTDSLEQTDRRLKSTDRVVIAEAAFAFESFFVRCDIVIKQGKTLYLYEVKSKSWQRDRSIFKTGKNGELTGIDSEISDYVYDVAFQKWVVSNALKKQGLSVRSFLLLADKDATATVDGLNQFFKIVSDGTKTSVVPRQGLTAKELGDDILLEVDTDQAAEWIFETPFERQNGETMPFDDYLRFLADSYVKDRRIKTPVGAKCKSCEFDAIPGELNPGAKSGFRECWKLHARFCEADFNKPLTLDLWSRGFRGKNNLIQSGKYFLTGLCEADIEPKKVTPKQKPGMSPLERRLIQITKAAEKDTAPYLDREGLRAEMATWNYPLHLIDFETCTSALPFHRGRRPYEGIAFQFSHHILNRDGTALHAGQFISFEPGRFPNYDFVRELKKQLSADNGSIFRYHNHENTFLNIIHRQLALETRETVGDADELMSFIKSIAHPTKDMTPKWDVPSRDMIDLYDIVVRYYYPPQANGSVSIKSILPAAIHDSPMLREKYGKAVYGKNFPVKSLNFDKKIWLTAASGMNPYKTLPRVFAEYDQEKLDSMVADMDEIREGGTAQKAYEKMQFSEIPVDQRELIRDALLKYCELDTLAMVMIVEFFISETADKTEAKLSRRKKP